jgi:hypothetical protein
VPIANYPVSWGRASIHETDVPITGALLDSTLKPCAFAQYTGPNEVLVVVGVVVGLMFHNLIEFSFIVAQHPLAIRIDWTNTL